MGVCILTGWCGPILLAEKTRNNKNILLKKQRIVLLKKKGNLTVPMSQN